MTKLLIGLLGAGVLATGGYAAATGIDTDPARTVSLPGATTGETTTTVDTTTAATTTAEDVSGPCDEAEHANDPRCIGATPAAPATTVGGDDHGDDDNSGPGSDDSGHGHGGDDDRSGSNSGKG